MDDLIRLQREVADLRGRLFALNVALAICVLLFMGLVWWTSPHQGPPGELTTSRLRLVDDEGRVRATLDIDPLGDASLRLYDENDVARASVRAGDDHATVELVDPEQHSRVRLSETAAASTLYLALDTRTAQLAAASDHAALAVVDLDRELTGEVRVGDGGAQVSVAHVPADQPMQGAALALDEDHDALGPEMALVNGTWTASASLHPKDGAPQMFLASDVGASRWTASDPEIRRVSP